MARVFNGIRITQNLMWTLALAMCLSLYGCSAPGRVTLLDDGGIALTGQTPKGVVPSYDTLASGYNQRVATVRAFNAQAQIEIIYHDRKGKRHYEQADQGRVVMVLPDAMAVLVRKFGIGDLFLAGSNTKNYWLFDLTASDHRVLYLGSQARGHAGRALALPVPVAPGDLPGLMGLLPLPIIHEQGRPAGRVEAVPGGYMLQPTVQSGSKPWRVIIGESDYLPVRVDLLDDSGKVAMTALLSKPVQIETEGKPPGAWPKIMARIELRPHGSTDYLIVHLSGLDDPGAEELNSTDRAFDLPRLKRIYKPDEVVDMDKR